MADMLEHKVVARDAWLEARKQFLVKEKEFTRLRDQLNQARRDLPWERVDKRYVFDGPNGQETLPELFDGRSQLIVYHFMFAPDWEEGYQQLLGLGTNGNKRAFEYAIIRL